MKKLAILLTAIGVLLGGCIAYEVPNGRGGGYHDRGHDDEHDRDRDRDGGHGRQDSRSNDSRY